MSTFGGFVEEYPLLSIDLFLKDNLCAKAFFLSHCHTDHMKGLETNLFYESISKRPRCKIYVSKVSKTLLLNMYYLRRIHGYLESIPIEHPTIITVLDENGTEIPYVTVTLLSSGHCPGSVMFFFEGANGNVLYTGDIRLEIGSIQRIKCLHHENGKVKPISSLHLDTTFCDDKCISIASRESCLDALSSNVSSWISKGPNFIVYLLCSANYGYEFVFMGLYKRFGIRTHIKCAKYRNMPSILEAVTNDPNETQIHSCWTEKDNLPLSVYQSGEILCGYRALNNIPVHVRCIKLSAMYFTSNININKIIVCNKIKEIFQACFSTHSSLEELWDMVSHLQPKSLHANVIHKNQTEDEVLKYLLPLVKDSEPKSEICHLGPLLESEKINSLTSFGSLDFDYNICLRSNNTINTDLSLLSKQENVGVTEDCIHDPQLLKDETVSLKDARIPCNLTSSSDSELGVNDDDDDVPKWSYSPCSSSEEISLDSDDVLKWRCSSCSNSEENLQSEHYSSDDDDENNTVAMQEKSSHKYTKICTNEQNNTSKQLSPNICFSDIDYADSSHVLSLSESPKSFKTCPKLDISSDCSQGTTEQDKSEQSTNISKSKSVDVSPENVNNLGCISSECSKSTANALVAVFHCDDTMDSNYSHNISKSCTVSDDDKTMSPSILSETVRQASNFIEVVDIDAECLVDSLENSPSLIAQPSAIFNNGIDNIQPVYNIESDSEDTTSSCQFNRFTTSMMKRKMRIIDSSDKIKVQRESSIPLICIDSDSL